MTTLTRADWEQRAKDLKIEGRAYINGEYTAAASGDTFECISPVDGRLLATVASCDVADAQRAVENARATFNSGVWSRLAPAKRKSAMIRFAALLKANAEELALLETLDMGKPISDSLYIDVPGAANALSWSGEAIDKIYDEVAATPHDQLGLVTREPVGVVGAIVPWNFPLMMACWKLGPALSTGNSVILKPSEKSPLTAIRIAALAVEAGIPKGVFNVLPGYGHTVGNALALHMDVDTLVFTGSTKIAKQLLIRSGESNMKRVWLEAGGKSPNIVFADAPDLLPQNMAVCDQRVTVDYFRLSADRRLLFGGACHYSGRDPQDIGAYMRPKMLKVFPQLADVTIDFQWGGMIGIGANRLPQIGRLADQPNVYYAQAYAGHGLNATHLAGKLLAEAISGQQQGRFDLFAQVPHITFPGGKYLRSPLLALGMLWHRFKELV